MRIPLDYYRILGLPIQATADQLRQAHRDRTLQLPRREYSDAAISARKQLLDQAQAVLSNGTQRQQYDTGFLAKTYDLASNSDMALDAEQVLAASDLTIDPHTPSIEVDDEQFIGALLILQELGEYELVLKLGRPFLTGGSANLKDRHYGDPTIVFSDIVLTVALACLELGREQWQQGQYENAAEALETGQQLLLREGLFVGVRGEIQSDLYRLRPYRILELLASADQDLGDRQTGMELLEDMLRERGGIDGTEDDQSGLNVDDFLRFVQQLRSYLTAEEQKQLFEREAARPSAVGTYLTIYALLAQGFADRQPALVYQAKQYLSRLSDRQDVHLERAICSLLLGQTEAASQSLELSQERESTDFIRQHSSGSPDLLPGLCLYTERWFNDEVFPHFQDLSQFRASLKEYFADRKVQAFLENLPTETEFTARRGLTSRPLQPVPSRLETIPARTQLGRGTVPPMAEYPGDMPSGEPSLDHDSLIETAKARIASRSATATLSSGGRFAGGVSTAERVDQPALGTETTVTPRSRVQRIRPDAEYPTDEDVRSPESRPIRRPGDRPPRNPRSSRNFRWLLPAGILLGVVLLGLLTSWLVKSLQPAAKPVAQDNEPLLVQLDKPLLQLTEADPSATTAVSLDQQSAQQLIEIWLAAKAKAMGSSRDITALDQILADPKLTEWRNAAEEDKKEGLYRNYTHDVKVESVELISSATGQVVSSSQAQTPTTNLSPAAGDTPSADTGSPTASPTSPTAASPATATASPTDSPAPDSTQPAANGETQASPLPGATVAVADQARVLATVSEKTEKYRDGKLESPAQTDNLRIQYNLVRKDGKWRIQDWQLQ